MDQHKKSNQFYMGFDKELNELSVQGIAKLERYLETHKEEIEKEFTLIMNTLIGKKKNNLRYWSYVKI